MYQPLSLQEYIQPANNNGIGMHHFPNGNHTDPAKHAYYLEEDRQMRVKWGLTLNMDQGTIAQFHAYGITPIIRPPWMIDHGWEDWGWFIQWQVATYGYAYWQIFNENRDNREWSDGQENLMVWAANTMNGLENVSNNGGYPGIQTLDPEDLRYLINYLRERGKLDLLNKAWMSVHAYPGNHPPIFPFDRRTYRQNPDKSFVLDENGQPIIATIHDKEGHSSLMVFLAFNRVMEEELGRVLPVLITEGGYRVGDDNDATYPVITEETHRDYNLAAYEMFRTGVMPNGEQLPDNVFCFCPWLANGDDDLGFANQSWLREGGNPRPLTVEAVKSMPPFVRRFAWDDTPIDPIDPPDEEEPMPTLAEQFPELFKLWTDAGGDPEADFESYLAATGNLEATPERYSRLADNIKSHVDELEKIGLLLPKA